MIRRDIKTRYTGSALGIFWSVINPIIMLLVLTFVFSAVFKIKIGGHGEEQGFLEYFLCGFLPWIAFQEGVLRSTSIIVENSNLVKRVRFPSELLIVSTVVSTFLLQLIGFVLFIAVLIIVGKIEGGSPLLLLPLILFLQVLFTLGLSYMLSSIQVFFRDIAQIAQSLFWVWFYATPIIYSMSMVPDRFKTILAINPMTHLVDIYRALILQGQPLEWIGLLYLCLSGLFLFFIGERIFYRLKPAFDDYL
jgi:ABC-type polysaccharide/polyol phosphate export permease